MIKASEEFKNTEYYKQALEIGRTYLTTYAQFVKDSTDFAFPVGSRLVEPNRYFDLLIVYFGYTAEDIKGEDKQLAFLAEARSNCIHKIVALEDMMKIVRPYNVYDFTSVITRVDALITIGKTELEAKLLVSQLQTNDNVQATNGHIRDSNLFLNKVFKWTLFVALGSLIISVLSVAYSIKDYYRETAKDSTEKQLLQVNSALQVKNLENGLLKNECDSLKRVLNSVNHMPLK